MTVDPTTLSDGAQNCLMDADRLGWIHHPIQRTLYPEPPRAWRSAHLAELERAGLIGDRCRREDGLHSRRLNRAGAIARATLLMGLGAC